MRKLSTLILLVLLALSLAAFGAAENVQDSYDATTMRLLRHEGTVDIFDIAGEPRFLLDNVRFASGESMRTGEDGKASVGLDDSKIVTLDADTDVEFIQEADHMRLNLREGALFLDVQEKLDENAALDIQTSNLTVGIRGTLVFLSSNAGDGENPAATTLGVLKAPPR